MIGIGVAVGVVILLVDSYLKRQGSSFRMHLMPIAVGMYLPFGLATPILLGGLMAHFITRDKPAAEHDRLLHRGVLFSSGVIAGEALMSVGLAVLAAMGIQALDLGLSQTVVSLLSLLAAAIVLLLFYRLSKPAL